MCGRTCCTLNAAQAARACGFRNGNDDSVCTVHMDRFRPSYNVSPGAHLPVFTVGNEGHGAEVGQPYHAVHCMKWGLIPSFTKKTEKPDHYRMFNARSESIKEKASFRRLIPNNRCLVAVDGFYEWKKDGSKKQPYYIHFSDGRPLVFAALYDSWENSEGVILYTFTILTTRSSSALEWLHDRMPVIFGSKGTIDIWLSKSPLKFETVLAPYTDFDLVWYPVTSTMGKPSFEGPECIKEITSKPVQNQISKLFSKKTDTDNKCKPEPACGKPSNDDKPNNLKEEPTIEDAEDDNKFKPELAFGKPSNDGNPNNLKEEPAIDDPEDNNKCKPEPECGKPSNVGKPKNLKEEPATDDAEELVDEKNIVGQAFHGIKREFEHIGPNLLDKDSTSVKKKQQSGDRQVSLLSYFGRK